MTPAISIASLARGIVQRYDRNGDGRITAAEVSSAAYSRGNVEAGIRDLLVRSGLDQKGATAEELGAAIAATFDTNHDGQLDLAESFRLGDVLGPAPVTTAVHTTYQDRRVAVNATIPSLAPVFDAKPVVFLNYDETLQASELGAGFTAVGKVLEPRAAAFDVSSSHANGNAASSLDIGFRLTNRGKAPLVLRVDDPTVGHMGRPAPKTDVGFMRYARRVPGGYRITLPPGASVDYPAASVDAHRPGGDPRDGSRMVTYRSRVSLESGDITGLAVQDVARFPKAGAKRPAMLPDPVSKKHHEGVFLPMRQITPPVLLSDGVEAALEIAGGQETHDAHYDVPHTFFVALPKGQQPTALVFRGGGGLTRPLVNGVPLPTRVGEIPALTGGHVVFGPNGDLQLRSRTELEVKPADFGKYLKDTGTCDANGNPVYQIEVTFVAGDNGDLGLYARY